MRQTIFTKLLWLLLSIAAFLVVLEFTKKESSFNWSKESSTVSKTDNADQPKPHERVGSQSIDQLTQQDAVVDYLVKNSALPPFYITKSQARAKGWDARKGNLCDALPGFAIGGDRFSNRERLLPEKSGRVWYEADINYDCGHRDAQRLLYSNDGLIYITKDHYKSVRQLR